LPTSYFGAGSGVGQAVAALRGGSMQSDTHPKNLRIGVIGLGIGTLAAYARPGDYLRFYEINPDVIRISCDTNYFTYLKSCPAKLEIVPGDARLSMERELHENASQKFDLLVLDAFAGDAVPVHLLTKEAFQLYVDELGPDGIIAAHITNTYLDLRPVLGGLAQHMQLNYVFVHSSGDNRVTMYNDWVLLSKSSVLRRLDWQPEPSRSIRLWTDDYSNLFQVLR
jgi:spermidine synthase